MSALKAQPEELDLHLYAGDGITIAFTFVEDGQPFPTTGEWLAEIVGAGVVDQFTINNDEPGGVVTLSLSGEQTAALWPKAFYDLQQVAPGAEPRTWYRGTITIEAEVSDG